MPAEAYEPSGINDRRPVISSGETGGQYFQPSREIELRGVTPAEVAAQGSKLVSDVIPVAPTTSSALEHRPDFEYAAQAADGRFDTADADPTAAADMADYRAAAEQGAEAQTTGSVLGNVATGAGALLGGVFHRERRKDADAPAVIITADGSPAVIPEHVSRPTPDMAANEPTTEREQHRQPAAEPALEGEVIAASSFHDPGSQSHDERLAYNGEDGPITLGAGERAELHTNTAGALGTYSDYSNAHPDSSGTVNIGLLDNDHTTVTS